MANWKQAAADALTYGAAGAVGGAPFGGIGAGIAGGLGAVAGGLKGLFTPSASSVKKKQLQHNKNMVAQNGQLPTQPSGNIITGKNPYISSASTLNPAQQQSQESILPGLTKSLQQPLDFQALQNETMRDYEQNIVPKISNIFTSNTNGKPSSPEFASQLRAGNQDLASRLNAQRSKFELEKRNQEQNLLGTLMGRSQENFYNEPTEGIVGTTLPHVTNRLLDLGIDKGIPAIANLFKTDPTKASSIIASMAPEQKAQVAEYLSSAKGAAKFPGASEAFKRASGSGSFLPTAGKAALGIGGAVVAGYALKSLFDHLLKD